MFAEKATLNYLLKGQGILFSQILKLFALPHEAFMLPSKSKPYNQKADGTVVKTLTISLVSSKKNPQQTEEV